MVNSLGGQNGRPEPNPEDISNNMTSLAVVADDGPPAEVPQQNESIDVLSADSDSEVSKIQRQFEIDYYFSAENLATDRFLLGKMRGRKNKSVPLGIIHQFKKMRNYQPFTAVVEAAKGCQNVDVIKEGGKWCLQRKTPFLRAEHLLGEEQEDAPKKPKVKPTGFEEYWTDPPITAEVYHEEQDLYHPSCPFAERIETALQRYKAKRKFHNHPADIFAKWMKYSGIDSSPKQFSGGLDQNTIDDKNAREIAGVTATTFVGDDKLEIGANAKWVVDFEGVTKGFLSSMVPFYFDIDTREKCKECSNIMRNFYNYIMHHNVCPEYEQDIYAARKICDIAETELFATYKALTLLPGEFNIACSTLFGGSFENSYVGDQSWPQGSEWGGRNLGMSKREARQVYSIGMAAYGKQEDIGMERQENQKKHFEQEVILVEEDIGLEVTRTIDADPKTRYFYEHEIPGKFKTLGRLLCKSWSPPDFAGYDLPADLPMAASSKQYEFWIDRDILEWCFVGMKLEATVRTLGGGLQILDNVKEVKCSFYTLLPNELLRRWKDPKFVTREEQVARAQRYGANGDDDVPAEEID